MKIELETIPGHFKMDVFVVTIAVGCLVFDIRLNLEIDQNMPSNSVDFVDFDMSCILIRRFEIF